MGSEFFEELKEWTKTLGSHLNTLNILRDNIKRDFGLPQLKDQLLALPEQIKKTQIIALQRKKELSDFEQQQMGQRVAEMFFEIGNEKGENGKAKFTNEPTRKAELTIRLDKDGDYQSLLKQRSAIESKVWEFEAEADRLRNDFRSRIAIKDLIVAELNLYTK